MIDNYNLSANFLTLLGILVPALTAILLSTLGGSRKLSELLRSDADQKAQLDRIEERVANHENRLVLLEYPERSVRRRRNG